MTNNILELIRFSQNRDEESLVELIKTFNPILKKYSKILNYNDAYFDLRYEFINTIYKLDTKKLEDTTEGQIVNYISKVVYHHYININKKSKFNREVTVFSDMSDTMLSIIETELATEDDKKYYELDFVLNKLTLKEQQLIKLIFYKNISIPEIATMYGISRQAINQKKKRIIQRMIKNLNESM